MTPADDTSRLAPPGGAEGLLLIGHGTRDAAGLAEFWQLVDRVRARSPGALVEGSLLELAEPDIAAGLQRLVARGAQSVRAVPLLLAAAGHARRDIPQALARAAAEHPGVRVRQTAHLGAQPEIADLSERRFHAALSDQQQGNTARGRPATGVPESMLLLLIGRGSSDAEAQRELAQFAARRGERCPQCEVQTAYVAMARPTVDEALAGAAGSAHAAVVVQPHLLFRGEVLAGLRQQVERQVAAVPGKAWLLTEHLGADELVAAAVWRAAGENCALQSELREP